jgi:hypothetical protein
MAERKSENYKQFREQHVNRTPVISSNVASVGYDPNTMTLEVEFTNGSVYQYFDVPELEYQSLMTAESLGKYLNHNIKSNYRYAQI